MFRNLFVISALLAPGLLIPPLSQAKDEKKEDVECVLPPTPTIPSGRKVSKKVMVEAMETVKSYQQKNNAYRECLTQHMEKLGDEATEQGKAAVESAIAESIDTEELVADTFNTQLRLFKTQNPN